MASTAVSTEPNAVITTTGNAAFCRLSVCRNSRPFIPGSLRSVTTRSTVFSRRSFSPLSASPAESVVKPSSPRFNSSSRRILASSSTIRIVGKPSGGCSPLPRPRPKCYVVKRNSLRCLCTRNLITGGEKDDEACPLQTTRFPVTVDADRSMMPIHDPGDDRQTQAHAGFFGADKRIENLFPQLCRNSWTGVFDPHFHSVPTSVVRPQCHDSQRASAAAHGIISILNQIHERLLTETLIQGNQRQVGFVLPLDVHWRVFAFLHQ